jgi:hypothetical protein
MSKTKKNLSIDVTIDHFCDQQKNHGHCWKKNELKIVIPFNSEGILYDQVDDDGRIHGLTIATKLGQFVDQGIDDDPISLPMHNCGHCNEDCMAYIIFQNFRTTTMDIGIKHDDMKINFFTSTFEDLNIGSEYSIDGSYDEDNNWDCATQEFLEYLYDDMRMSTDPFYN